MSRSSLPFSSVLIYGMGMMGASLAYALKKSDLFQGSIAGVVRGEKSAAFIRENGLAQEVYATSLPGDSERLDPTRYDLIVIGLTIRSSVRLLGELPPVQCLITDMCSTRREIEAAAVARPDLRFIGSHPMCGSEDSGPSSLREDLYGDKLCLLTPRPETPEEDVQLVGDLWRAVGMKTCVIEPEPHDEILAYLSHAPHVIAGLLTNWALDNPSVARSIETTPMPVTGGGFKDMARIAGSNPEMWTDILETNRENLIIALEDFQNATEAALDLLRDFKRDDWLDWFVRARRARNTLCGYPEDA